ncbi:MAG: M28 family peptidase [Candidatus Sumerlaeaceae bacterium]|nr:M28 family peptidase [Candidatus Sumerlaeaceae bacterium]
MIAKRPLATLLVCCVPALICVAVGAPKSVSKTRNRIPSQATTATGEIVLTEELRRDLDALCNTIGERNVARPENLARAADYITTSLAATGLKIQEQTYVVEGVSCKNLWVELVGTTKPDEIVIIGAHYDSALGSPGANDNGTGAVSVLALVRRFAKSRFPRTVRFVEFTNEEPPWFQTAQMGSLVYAKACRERKEKIVAMVSLETMGYYSGTKNSQRYPSPAFNMIYPSTGNFLSFIGNSASRKLVDQAHEAFRRATDFPAQHAAVPGAIEGVGFSDHWSFWKQGFPAIMVTDTAYFRYPYYHTPRDKPEMVQVDNLARVVLGLESVVESLGTTEP